MRLLQIERMSKLGLLGEILTAERLKESGFVDIEDLNVRRTNYPFADLIASQGGKRFLIGVKSRNEMRQGGVGLNESYNLVLASKLVNAELKRQGKTTDEITTMLLAEVVELARLHGAIPAWVTVAVRPNAGTFSAYFGLVSDLGIKRSVPMTPKACDKYLCLARDLLDRRITPDLINN